jgi:methylenetetrahydrofolate dehydrogenase (NADP+)/methenyltetrahydrofolate cyclohydrolase
MTGYAKDAVIVDAGTAGEGGKVVGDVSDEVRERQDIKAITPLKGGVGPLTVSALFENTLQAASINAKD